MITIAKLFRDYVKLQENERFVEMLPGIRHQASRAFTVGITAAPAAGAAEAPPLGANGAVGFPTRRPARSPLCRHHR